MRFPEDKIKQAILHPDIKIRDRAVHYFAKAFSPDPAIMPLVIQAVETYGRKDAYRLIGPARDLRQSETSIAWVLNELKEPQTDQYDDTNYAYNLALILVQADVALLLPREADILQARHFLPELAESLTERLRMAGWDEATCWQKLEEFCEAVKDKQSTNDVDLSYARHIVEALARHGKSCEERVHAILSEKITSLLHHPMNWLEPLTARVAGLAHLDSTIPLLVAKLVWDADLLSAECTEALIRIGTPAVVNALAAAFPAAPFHFLVDATGPLERIHSDLAVEKAVYLLRQEQDERIRLHLAESLLGQFAYDGIEAARQLLLGRALDFESRGLRPLLLETCAFMGERFPEYDKWLAAEKAEEEHGRRVQEREGNPEGLLLYALEKLAGKRRRT